MGEKNTYWDGLAQDMENGNYTTVPGQTVTGEAAVAEGAAMLRAVCNTDDLEQIKAMRRGRPAPARQAAGPGGGVEDAASTDDFRERRSPGGAVEAAGKSETPRWPVSCRLST